MDTVPSVHNTDSLSDSTRDKEYPGNPKYKEWRTYSRISDEKKNMLYSMVFKQRLKIKEV